MYPGVMLGIEYIPPAAEGMSECRDAGKDERLDGHGYKHLLRCTFTPREFGYYPTQVFPAPLPALSTCELFPSFLRDRDPANVTRRAQPVIAPLIQVDDPLLWPDSLRVRSR